MRTIILPQAIKNILPAIGNEMIALLKETSVAGYVSVRDLTKMGSIIQTQTYDAFNPILLECLKDIQDELVEMYTHGHKEN